MNDEIEMFFAENAGRWAPKVTKGYARYMERVSSWLEAKGVTESSKVTTSLLVEWLDRRNIPARRSALNVLRIYFRWAMGEQSPAARIRFPKAPESSRRALLPGEVMELLAVPDTSTVKGKRDLAILAVMLDTGIRNAELCNALISNLVLKERSLRVFIKGARWEWCVFSEYTQRALEEWLNVRDEIAIEDRHIFVSIMWGAKAGSALGVSGLEYIIRSIARKAGIGHVVPHQLRHSFAEISLRAGSSTRLLQRAGRWKNIQMVEHYTKRIELEAFRDYLPMTYLMESR